MSSESTDFVPISTFPQGFTNAISADSQTPSDEGGRHSDATTPPTDEATSPSLLTGERRDSCAGDKDADVVARDQQRFYCGVGACRPRWMQRFVNAKFFTFLLCLNCFIEGALVSGGRKQSTMRVVILCTQMLCCWFQLCYNYTYMYVCCT